MQEQIGNTLKQVRISEGITLQMLSDRTGLSVGYLSMLERGLNSPTIASLQKVCAELNITFNELLSNLDNTSLLIRKQDRRVIYMEADHVKYEAVTQGQRSIKSICMTVYDDAEHMSERHIADEFGYLVAGSMLMCVNGVRYEMQPGDALYIPANSPHSFRKVGADACVSVWAYHNIAASREERYPALAEQR